MIRATQCAKGKHRSPNQTRRDWCWTEHQHNPYSYRTNGLTGFLTSSGMGASGSAGVKCAPPNSGISTTTKSDGLCLITAPASFVTMVEAITYSDTPSFVTSACGSRATPSPAKRAADSRVSLSTPCFRRLLHIRRSSRFADEEVETK